MHVNSCVCMYTVVSWASTTPGLSAHVPNFKGSLYLLPYKCMQIISQVSAHGHLARILQYACILNIHTTRIACDLSRASATITRGTMSEVTQEDDSQSNQRTVLESSILAEKSKNTRAKAINTTKE